MAIESYYDVQFKRKQRITAAVFLLIGLIAGFALGYLFFVKTNSKYDDLKDNLAKVIKLPDEEPTIAEILNTDELIEKNPTFYADVKEGDLLIVYSNKAIIFRESENKIISIYNL